MRDIELLVANEELISKLYAIYAEKFPKEKEFWLNKAAEEDIHAELLQALRSIIRKNNYFFEEGRFSIKAIELSISYLENVIQKAGNYSLINALSVAEDIKNSLIEQDFLKLFLVTQYSLKILY